MTSAQSLRAGAPENVTVHRLIDLEAAGADTVVLLAGVARIFRATAARWPVDAAAVRAFQDLWLDQYVRFERELVYVAMRGVGPAESCAHLESSAVVGYLVGCRINPATSPRFHALTYFAAFAAACAAFPAHLHVNIDEAFRGQRIGERLLDAVCARLTNEGVAGVHVVTGRDQRNVVFYCRNGFRELARTARGATEVLFLGRQLREPS